MSRAYNRHGEKRKAYGVSVGKPKERKPLGRSILRWEDNIKMDLREIEWGCMDWIYLVPNMDQWRALVNTE
jgi:hypothetical protein